MQAVPLSTRKATGGSSEGIAPFLQLPHFSEAVVKKIARKVSNTMCEKCEVVLALQMKLKNGSVYFCC